MAITFKTKAHASITMLGEDGSRMLEMMGFGTSVPGAIDADDIGRALANLRAALARLPDEPIEPGSNSDDDDDDRPPVSPHTRALPLIKLLQAAADQGEYVRWE